jgi:hypothetical protein
MAGDPWADFRLPASKGAQLAHPGGSSLAFDMNAAEAPSQSADPWAEFRVTPQRERGALDLATQVPVGFNETLAVGAGWRWSGRG